MLMWAQVQRWGNVAPVMHGRHGTQAYVGAQRVECRHETLAVGQRGTERTRSAHTGMHTTALARHKAHRPSASRATQEECERPLLGL
jgi:hypothetical protein